MIPNAHWERNTKAIFVVLKQQRFACGLVRCLLRCASISTFVGVSFCFKKAPRGVCSPLHDWSNDATYCCGMQRLYFRGELGMELAGYFRCNLILDWAGDWSDLQRGIHKPIQQQFPPDEAHPSFLHGLSIGIGESIFWWWLLITNCPGSIWYSNDSWG